MKETIKEMKRDIINGYLYTEVEFTDSEVDSALVYEDGKILYYTYKEYLDGYVSAIIYDRDEFLKDKIENIIKRINETNFYL